MNDPSLAGYMAGALALFAGVALFGLALLIGNSPRLFGRRGKAKRPAPTDR